MRWPDELVQLISQYSIGSNGLTRLTRGVERNSDLLRELFDEQDEAVNWVLEHVIDAARQGDINIGICGQAPSDHP